VGVICQLVFQPVIKLIQVAVSVIEYILVQVCRFIQGLVSVVTEVLTYICNTVVHSVCNAVCSVVCGICDFFCGILGCDCHCENVCNSVCNVITDVVCAWTYVIVTIIQAVAILICTYIVQAVIAILNLVEAIVTMVLTWVCTLVDIIIRWLLCWTYIAEIFNNTKPRRFQVAPKIIRNSQGHSDWFVYVNNPDVDGNVDQNMQGYILSDGGRPLMPVLDPDSADIAYYEIAVDGDHITGAFKRAGHGKDLVPGQPFLYYPYKVMEISSHLFGDIFASAAADDGSGTDFHRNLFTYSPDVQAWLASDGKLATNNYNTWAGKYTSLGGLNYFGDMSVPDMGMRVDTDSTCSHPTNTFLHVENIGFTPGDTAIAENMTCGASQTLTFDQTNFLLLNKDNDSSAVTTYFVSKYNPDESSVGCNDALGYTVVSFQGNSGPLFISAKVLPFTADTNQMMAIVVKNISSENPAIVRVAETYLHECGHQCGLLHESDAPDCENDTTLHIAKVMNPFGYVRRAYTRFEWCMIRTSWYVTSRSLQSFVQAPELPDSHSVPPPPVK
jgi:hypothetical protein